MQGKVRVRIGIRVAARLTFPENCEKCGLCPILSPKLTNGSDIARRFRTEVNLLCMLCQLLLLMVVVVVVVAANI